jgi:hypothetical protein
MEMASGTMIFIPSFVKVGSGIRKFLKGYTCRHAQTHRQQGDLISAYLYFFFFFFFKMRKVTRRERIRSVTLGLHIIACSVVNLVFFSSTY